MKSENIFAERVKKMRIASNMTQPQLGEAVGLSKQAINDIEKGRRETTISKAILLAKTLGTTIEYLSGDTNNISRPDVASPIESFFSNGGGGKLIDRLSRLCNEQGVTFRELEDVSEVGEMIYSALKPASLPSLIALADYLDVSLDYLVGRSDDPSRR